MVFLYTVYNYKVYNLDKMLNIFIITKDKNEKSTRQYYSLCFLCLY